MKKKGLSETKKFFREIIDGKNDTSSKRFVTLLTAGCFFIAQFLIIFIAFYVIFYTPRGRVDINLLNLLKEVLEYDFYIILSGLGFITMEGVTNVMIEKAKNKMSSFSQSTTTETNTNSTGIDEPFHGEKNEDK